MKRIFFTAVLLVLVAFTGIHAQDYCSPTFVVFPTNQIQCENVEAVIQAQAVSETDDLDYKWQVLEGNVWSDIVSGTHDGAYWEQAIVGKQSILTISDVSSIDYFSFRQVRCVAKNTCGSTESNAATITFHNNVEISHNPKSQGVCVGSNVDLWVGLSQGGPYSYQWYRNDLAIPYYSATLRISTLRPQDAGKYTVQVKTACNFKISEPANITIIDASPVSAKIIDNGIDRICAAPQGSDGSTSISNTVTYQVNVTSGSVASYSWQILNDQILNGNDIWEPLETNTLAIDVTGAISPVLQLISIPYRSKSYQIRCTLYAQCDPDETPIHTIPVNLKIDDRVVLTPLMSMINPCIDDVATISHLAESETTFDYVWHKFNEDDFSLDVLEEPTTSMTNNEELTFQFDKIVHNDAGTYFLSVYNACDSLSTATVVNVTQKPHFSFNLPGPVGATQSICAIQDYTIKPIFFFTEGPYFYEWSLDGKVVSSQSEISEVPDFNTSNYLASNDPDALLLDVIKSEPSLAFGLRKLRKDYTGNCVRVRNSFGYSIDIGFTQDGSFDIETFTDHVGANAATVEIWYNQMPGGAHASQADADKQPVIALVGVDNLPEITFDGIDDELDTGKKIDELTNNSEGDVQMVFRIHDENAVNGTLFGAKGVTWAWNMTFNKAATNWLINFANGSTPATSATVPTTDLTSWTQFSGLGASASQYFDNGTTPHTLTPGHVPVATGAETHTFTIGNGDDGGVGQPMKGKFKEFILTPGTLPEVERNSIDISQKAYYGILTGPHQVNGSVRLASDYTYTGTLTATHLLDASNVPYLIAPHIQLDGATTAKVIRPFIPTDLLATDNGGVLSQWIDFSDTTTMTFVDPTIDSSFDAIEDKSGNTGPDRSFKVSLGLTPPALYAPVFRNGRMESDKNRNPSGHGQNLLSNYEIETSNNNEWGLFYAGGYLVGGSNRRRIIQKQYSFDEDGDFIYGFKDPISSGGYEYFNQFKNNFRLDMFDERDELSDTEMHLFNFRQFADGEIWQEWDNLERIVDYYIVGLTEHRPKINLEINDRSYNAYRWTDNYALQDIIVTEGELTLVQTEKIMGYLAWHANIPHKLPHTSNYAQARPLTTLPINTEFDIKLAVSNECNIDDPLTSTMTVKPGVCDVPKILSYGQPKDATACASTEQNVESVSFSVKAINVAQYKWQYRRNQHFGNKDFKDLPATNNPNEKVLLQAIVTGFDTNTIVLDSVTASLHNYQLRCQLIGKDGVALNSYYAKIKININGPAIASFEPNTQICGNSKIELPISIVIDNANGPYTYTWTKLFKSAEGNIIDRQVVREKIVHTSTDGYYRDMYIEGYVTDDNVYSVDYQVTVKNACPQFIDELASFSYSRTLPIIEQKLDDLELCNSNGSGTGTFDVQLNNTYIENVKYQWEFSSNNGMTWINATEGVTSDVTKKTLIITQPPPALYSGNLYRCKLTNSCGTVYTNEPRLLVNTGAPVIISEPGDIEMCITPDNNLGRSIQISANDVNEYQWVDVGTNSEITDSDNVIRGSKTNILTFYGNSISTYDMSEFQCQLTNACGTTLTNSFVVNIDDVIPTVGTVTDQVICSGITAPITFTDAGGGTSGGIVFLWENDRHPETGIHTNGNKNIVAFETNSDLIILPVTDVISATPALGACLGDHTVVTSLTVNPVPTLTATPVDEEICSNISDNLKINLTAGPAWLDPTKFLWDVEYNGKGQPDDPIEGIVADGSNGLTGRTELLKETLINTSLEPISILYAFKPRTSFIDNDNQTQICEGKVSTVTVTVNPTPTIAQVNDQPDSNDKDTYCHGERIEEIIFTPGAGGTPEGTTFHWNNIQTSIGLLDHGDGNISPFTINNTTKSTVIAQLKAHPKANGCLGDTVSFSITVSPVPGIQVTDYNPVLCSGESPNIKLIDTKEIPQTLFIWTVDAKQAIDVSGYTENPSGDKGPIDDVLTNAGTNDQVLTYSVTPTVFSCEGKTEMIDIRVNPVPTFTAEDGSVCSKEKTNIPLLAPNVNNPLFTWTVTSTPAYGATNQSIGIPGPLEDILELPQGETQSKVVTYDIVSHAFGCNGNKQTVSITVHPQPDVTLDPADQVYACNGQQSTITINSNIGTKYTWKVLQLGVTGAKDQLTGDPTGLIQHTLSLSGVLDGTAIYEVKSHTDEGCMSEDVANMVVSVTKGIKLINDLSDIKYCDDKPVALNVLAISETLPLTYQWQESRNAGLTWTDIFDNETFIGTSTSGLLLSSASSAFSGFSYQVVIEDGVCPGVASSKATINSWFSASSALSSASVVEYGESVVFSFLNPPDETTVYNWDFGDGWTSVVQNPEHNYFPPIKLEGPFKVSVEAIADNYGCRKTYELPPVTVIRKRGRDGNVFTGDIGTEPNSVSAYPVPFTELLTISADHPIKNISIIDMPGRQISNHDGFNQHQVSFNTGSLKPGVYVALITFEEHEPVRIKVNKK